MSNHAFVEVLREAEAEQGCPDKYAMPIEVRVDKRPSSAKVGAGGTACHYRSSLKNYRSSARLAMDKLTHAVYRQG